MLPSSVTSGAQRCHTGRPRFPGMWSVVRDAVGAARYGPYSLTSLAALILAGVAGFTVTGKLLDPLRRRQGITTTGTASLLGTGTVSPYAVDLPHGDSNHQWLQVREQTLFMEELNRMQSLVDDLLLLARSGRPGFVKREWVDVDSFLAESMDRIKVMAERRWQIDDMPSGRLWADPDLLSQLVDRLAVNAVQSTTDRDVISLGAAWIESPAINSSVEYDKTSASTIEIWVADSGCGISAADQERIFHPFTRLGLPREQEGAGLGLTVVKAIVEAHQGSVRVNSRPNVGSRFVLSLPGEAEQEPDQAAASTQAPGRVASPRNPAVPLEQTLAKSDHDQV